MTQRLNLYDSVIINEKKISRHFPSRYGESPCISASDVALLHDFAESSVEAVVDLNKDWFEEGIEVYRIDGQCLFTQSGYRILTKFMKLKDALASFFIMDKDAMLVSLRQKRLLIEEETRFTDALFSLHKRACQGIEKIENGEFRLEDFEETPFLHEMTADLASNVVEASSSILAAHAFITGKKADVSARASIPEFYKLYTKECAEADIIPLGRKHFNRTVRERGFYEKNDNGRRLWIGLAVPEKKLMKEYRPVQ